MRKDNAARGLAVALAATAALAAAGCAWTVPPAREGAVTVKQVERVRWDLPPEPGLFRVRFDKTVAAQIRRRAEDLMASFDVDYFNAEMRALEHEAERELKARGLCRGSVSLLESVEGGDGQSGIGAVFKCRPPVF